MADTTLSISKEFHDWLKSKGKKGESYEGIIKRLLGSEFQQEPKEEPQQEQPGNADDIGSIDNL